MSEDSILFCRHVSTPRTHGLACAIGFHGGVPFHARLYVTGSGTFVAVGGTSGSMLAAGGKIGIGWTTAGVWTRTGSAGTGGGTGSGSGMVATVGGAGTVDCSVGCGVSSGGDSE